MDMTLMGGEVTYIRNRLETGGFNATEYSKSRGENNNQAYVWEEKDLNTINQKFVKLGKEKGSAITSKEFVTNARQTQ